VIAGPLLSELLRRDNRNYNVENGECESHDYQAIPIGVFRPVKLIARLSSLQETANGSSNERRVDVTWHHVQQAQS